METEYRGSPGVLLWGGDGRLGLESVGFEGLLGFRSGAQEGHHLINGTELVGGELLVKGKRSVQSCQMGSLSAPRS